MDEVPQLLSGFDLSMEAFNPFYDLIIRDFLPIFIAFHVLFFVYFVFFAPDASEVAEKPKNDELSELPEKPKRWQLGDDGEIDFIEVE